MDTINKEILDNLISQAKASPRLRMNLDMRTSAEDNSQRMLNALEPGTIVAVHRHTKSTETVAVLRGSLKQIYYSVGTDGSLFVDSEDVVTARSECPFYIVPKGVWHTSVALESGTVIFEAKDGKYGQDGSETFEQYLEKI